MTMTATRVRLFLLTPWILTRFFRGENSSRNIKRLSSPLLLSLVSFRFKGFVDEGSESSFIENVSLAFLPSRQHRLHIVSGIAHDSDILFLSFFFMQTSCHSFSSLLGRSGKKNRQKLRKTTSWMKVGFFLNSAVSLRRRHIVCFFSFFLWHANNGQCVWVRRCAFLLFSRFVVLHMMMTSYALSL